MTVAERKNILDQELKRIVVLLREQYDPERIILFGSLASGSLHEWSDIDLVIIKETDKRPLERCLDVGRIIHPQVGIDIFVYTPEEFRLLEQNRYSLVMEILEHGKVMYEKRN